MISLSELPKKIMKDSLYMSSAWLMATSITGTLFGFLFWTFNSRLFSEGDIGLASTLISAAELIVLLSLLGFEVALVRYLSRIEDKHQLISTTFTIGSVVAIILGSGFLLLFPRLFPSISIRMGLFSIIVLLYVVLGVQNKLFAGIFIGMGQPRFVFFKAMTFNLLKVILPFALILLGALGIMTAWMIGLGGSVLVGFILLELKPRLSIKLKVLEQTAIFSLSNYIGNFLAQLPGLIFPILTTIILSAERTAYFYMAWMMSLVLYMVPLAVSQSLLAAKTSSHHELQGNIKKALQLSFGLLVPGVLLSMVLAPYLLLLFGPAYSAHATTLFRLLAASSIPATLSIIYVSINNILHRVGRVILINLIIAVMGIGASVMFLSHGLVMVGIVWLSVQSLVGILSLTGLIKVMSNG